MKRDLVCMLRLCGIIIICFLGIIIYSNTFNSSFHFDDVHSIVRNYNIKHLSNLRPIWNYWPTRFITYLSFAFNYHFNQSRVFGYHLFNLIIHLISAILVWWFTLLVFSTPLMEDKTITRHAHFIAFFVALVFIAHPIQTQAITYIVQRAASLATLFYLVSLNLYVKSRLLQQQKQTLGIWRFYYTGSLVTTVIAMFTKEIAITLPLMILLFEFCFLKTKKGLNWRQLTPLLFTLLVIPLTMVLTRSINLGEMRRAVEPSPQISISAGHYLLTQFRVIVTYLRLLFLPINQNLDYDYHIAQSLFEFPTLVSLLLLLLIIITAIRILTKYRLISFAVFWVFLSLLPESSIIPIPDVIFEHRLYLPMVGYSLFLVSSLYYLFNTKTLKFTTIILFLLIASYSVLTYNRNRIWKDELTLWNDTVYKSPKKARPYHNRGLAYQDKDDLDQAISDYNKVIEINPANAETYNNLGNIYKLKRNLKQALFEYAKAIEICPTYAEAYFNRGDLCQINDSLDQALSDYTKAIEIDPVYFEAYNNRGVAYQNKGNLDQAISDFNKAIEILPTDVEAYNNRGVAYQDKDDLDQAISDYNKVIEINPTYAVAYYNLATVYFSKKEYDKSWDNVHRAESLGLKANPNFLGELKKASGRE